MYILGLNAYHGDSSACIYKDGILIAATEEERFRRIKHWAGLPTESIKFCLREAGIELEDVDYITISRDPAANRMKKILFALRKIRNVSRLASRFANMRKVGGIKKQIADAFGVKEESFPAKVFNCEHHRAHLASTFFPSPFEESAIISIDGFGDFTSTMIGMGRGNKIEVYDSVIYPHSIGIMYTAFTQFLGFNNYGDEYKIMGLAPYGNPTLVDKVKDVIHFRKDGLFELNTRYFTHHTKGVKMSWEGGEPTIGALYSNYMVKQFGEPRKKRTALTQFHLDLAASVQTITEEVIFHMLNHLYMRTGCKNVCIAGGVAQNSAANGKILANTPFKNLYIPSAGHDAGTSIGSALFLYHNQLDNPRTEPVYSAYSGSRFDDEQIQQILDHKNIRYTKVTDDQLYDIVTDALLDGSVVGWFQGRAEFGPRALGNRSIIVDPRRNDAKDILNKKIKKRESFRPFAPSILEEFVKEYFECNDIVPFMEKVYPIRPEKHAIIPAVTHVDGTGRLQTVKKDVNPKYYGLIHRFYEKTGVPILLNTSFNENEPIVNTPQEALHCFMRTKMDMLVLGNYLVERRSHPEPVLEAEGLQTHR